MPIKIADPADDNRTVTLDIVDGQMHSNQFGHDWRTASHEHTLDLVVAAMDVMGISALVLDEFTGIDAEGRMLPGEVEADGVWRPRRPFSQLARARYPERFRYLGRIDRLDPKMPQLMRAMREEPHGASALRMQWGPKRVVWTDPEFATGGYNAFFEQAEKNGIPIFLNMSPRMDLLVPYAKRFPRLKFVIDHMGVVSGVSRPPRDELPEQRLKRFDPVLELAQYRNVYLKWCHVERFAYYHYPFPDCMPALRRVVDAFGADRVMWAGDSTESCNPEKTDFPITWSQTLFHVLDAQCLTVEEKSWVLGRTTRRIMDWN